MWILNEVNEVREFVYRELQRAIKNAHEADNSNLNSIYTGRAMQCEEFLSRLDDVSTHYLKIEVNDDCRYELEWKLR